VLGQATGTWTHKTHHGPNSGEATTFPHIVFSAARSGGYIQMAQIPGTPETESRNCPDRTPETLNGHNFRLQSLIVMRFNQSCSPHRDLSNAMLHTQIGCWEEVNSRILVVGNQTDNLTPGPSSAHNLGCRCPNGQCEAIFNIYVSRPFHTWPKWGCDMFCYYKVKLNLNNLQMDQAIQNVQKSLIIQNIILEFETISFINSCWLIMSSNTMFQIKNKKARWHIYTNLEKKIGSNIAIVFHNASKCNCSNFKVVVYCWSKATTHDFGAKNVLIKCQIFLTNRLGNKWLQNQNEKMIYSNELEGDLKPELTWNIQDFYS
jgi:hypothetical protein